MSPTTSDQRAIVPHEMPGTLVFLGDLLVIMGRPGDMPDEWSDAHNCDDMGCGSVGDHVLAKVHRAGPDGPAVDIVYTNWRGETATRRIRPIGVHFGASEWHPAHQWHLRAFDLDRGAERHFALTAIGTPRSLMAEAVDCEALRHIPARSDRDLLTEAIRHVGRGGPKRPRWAAVRDLLGHGSTVSYALCVAAGLDGDEMVGIEPDEVTDADE